MLYSATNPLSVAVLISGNGTNLQAIINAIREQNLPVVICVVLSNRQEAYGLERARAAGIPTEVVLRSDYPDRPSYDRALQTCLDAYKPDLLILAGFMHILSAEFVAHYPQRILNIHPSLLPKYPGLHTHRRVLEAGDVEHGATVHIVTPELDAGPILAQAAVAVEPGDTEASLAQKVHALEYKLYPEVIREYALQRR